MVNNASITRYGDTVGLVNFPGPDADGSATAERWLDYAAGAIPASKRVSDRYGADIPSYDLFRANADNVWDFTGGSPDTQTVRDVFYTGIHDLLMGKTTPEDGNGHCRADQGIAQKEERAALSRVAKGDPPTTKY